ncbi:MAG: MAB_1171c family putative transporter [Pseudonocardiaceae bacterium]
MELFLQAASVLPPGIASAQQNFAQRRILWTLWPLWQSLTGTIPGITLPGPGSRLGALVTTVADLNLRVYRLVIEIRDASLALRAYVTPAMVAAAQQFAAARQIPLADLDTAAAACWLETARQAKLAGKPPRSTVSDITSPGGTNLQDEIGFLLNVARFHSGPLPAEFAANHLAEVA